jgi:hypothetical protein
MANDPADPREDLQRCRNELDRLVKELELKSRSYRLRAKGCYFWWKTLEIVVILAGFLSAIFAALMKQETFASYGQVALIVTPSLGSAAAALLSLLRFKDLKYLREQIHIDLDDLVNEGWGLLAGASTVNECLEAHKRLRLRALELERTHSVQLRKLFATEPPPAKPETGAASKPT